MAANINDKFSKVSTGVRPKTTAVAGVRAPSGTTLTCDDLTGWTTDTAVHFVTYKADAQGKVVAGSQTDFKGIVSGNSIINLTVRGGNDNGNAVGDIVQALPTAGFAKDLADGLMVSHNQDGTLKPNVVNTQAIENVSITAAKTAFGGDYSTSEVNTGFKWIDGKSIYKKTVNTGVINTAAIKHAPHGITGVSDIIHIDSIVKLDAGSWLTMPYNSTASGSHIFALSVTNANIVIKSAVDTDAGASYVTLFYTKTT